MPDNENKPDYAPKSYNMPKMDFSDAKLEKAPTQTETKTKTYTVDRGDNLSAIAQQWYGDPNQWPRLFEANRNQIVDPNLIYPGQVLRIPKIV